MVRLNFKSPFDKKIEPVFYDFPKNTNIGQLKKKYEQLFLNIFDHLKELPSKIRFYSNDKHEKKIYYDDDKLSLADFAL